MRCSAADSSRSVLIAITASRSFRSRLGPACSGLGRALSVLISLCARSALGARLPFPLGETGRICGGLGAALHAELRQQVAHIVLDGLLGEVHRLADLTVGHALGD